MSSVKGKVKGVDWKTTANILSSTPNLHPLQDEGAASYTAAEAVKAILTTNPDGLHSPDGPPTAVRQGAMKEFDTINSYMTLMK